jgi:hypothetical protein
MVIFCGQARIAAAQRKDSARSFALNQKSRFCIVSQHSPKGRDFVVCALGKTDKMFWPEPSPIDSTGLPR